MSTYVAQTDVNPRTLARSSAVNDLDTAIKTAFDLLPDEDDLKKDLVSFAVDSGVADAYVVTMSYTQTSYTDGLKVRMRPLNTNTGASTINVDALGLKSIKLPGSSDPSAGDINAGAPVELIYSSATGYFHIFPNSTVDAATATTQATNAASSASAAASSASAAATSETNAATSETNINSSISDHNLDTTSHQAIILDEDDFASDSNTKVPTQQSVKAFVGARMPTGASIILNTDTVPAGFLEENGAIVSRTTYADLYAAIGTRFGVGDGSTTFAIPDKRGQFLRGWSHASTADPDAASRTDAGAGTTGDNVGTRQATEIKAHVHVSSASDTTLNRPIGTAAAEAAIVGTQTGSTGGSESRPLNINVMFCIKY